MEGRINYPYTTKYVEGKLDDQVHGINFKKVLMNILIDCQLCMRGLDCSVKHQLSMTRGGAGFYQYNLTEEERGIPQDG